MRAEAVATSVAHEVVHVPSAGLPVRGPRFAPVTLDVYVAFGHSPSSAGAELAKRAVERSTDVREVLHLTGYLQNNSDLAAEAAVEAEVEGRFWPFVDHLFHERAAPGAAELVHIGREVGLDADRLEAALTTRRHRATVERMSKDVRLAGHGAGEVTINGRRLSAWSTDDVLAAGIQYARGRAQLLLDAGVPLSRVYDKLLDEIRDEAQREVVDVRPPRRRVATDLTGAPARGPSLAPVTLVVFANLAVGACIELDAAIRRVRANHPAAVREVWKHWIPPYAMYGVETIAAELAAGAAAQDRFWELHDLVLGDKHLRARPSKAELELLAQKAGVDLTRLSADQKSSAARVAADTGELKRLGLLYGPSVLVNGVPLNGPMTYERLEQLVSDELARGILERIHTESSSP